MGSDVQRASDWADGKIARLLDQSSRLGVLLDPAVDRLYMVAVPSCWRSAGSCHGGSFVLLARDGLLAATLPLLWSRGLSALPVTYIGKAATFALMSGFRWCCLALGRTVEPADRACGWAFLIWGIYMLPVGVRAVCGAADSSSVRQLPKVVGRGEWLRLMRTAARAAMTPTPATARMWRR